MSNALVVLYVGSGGTAFPKIALLRAQGYDCYGAVLLVDEPAATY